MAFGGLTTIGALAGIDALMNYYGYETDQWGRRWMKKGPDGTEVVHTLASPVNKTLKYAYWLYDFGRPEDTELGVGRMLDRVKMETGPMIKATLSLAENRKMGGDSVYNKFDELSVQLTDAAEFMFRELVGIADLQLGEEHGGRWKGSRPSTRAKLEKEIGAVVQALSFLQTMHVYARKEPKQKMARDILTLNTDYEKDIRKAKIMEKKYDKKAWKANYERRIDAIVKRQRLREQRRRRR